MSTSLAHQLDSHAARPRMTWDEIKAAYPDEWVFLDDLDSDPVTLELFSARVRGHGATRREARASAGFRSGEPGTFARLYTGRPRCPRPW